MQKFTLENYRRNNINIYLLIFILNIHKLYHVFVTVLISVLRLYLDASMVSLLDTGCQLLCQVGLQIGITFPRKKMSNPEIGTTRKNISRNP